MKKETIKRIVVAISGASGVIYGKTMVDVLSERKDVEIHLVVSRPAAQILEHEAGVSLAELTEKAHYGYDYNNVGAPIASGSFPVEAMVVVPCSMKTLASIAHGYANNLISRAADVTLKERRRLIVMPRETPLNRIHLENMIKITDAGGIILPAMPGFYHLPETIDDLVYHLIGKAVQLLGLPQTLYRPWKGDQSFLEDSSSD